MPRTARAAAGGVVYHVLNRSNGRGQIFRKDEDFAAFLKLLAQGRERANVEVFAFCLMHNHWHLLLRPRGDRDLAAYLSWVTNTHVKRYRSHYPTSSGHLYQGRFKSFPVQEDGHFLTAARYVEANPLRAGMVPHAEHWAWSSLGCGRKSASAILSPWPVQRPRGWTGVVNEPQPKLEMGRVLESIQRGRPLGEDLWVKRTAARLGLDYTLNPRGRPRKTEKPSAET
jgi:putative transposase